MKYQILTRMGFLAIMAMPLLMPGSASADFSYAGCAALKDADFSVDTLVNRKQDRTIYEPMKMAFDMDDLGNVDIYFTQRTGEVRRYNAISKKVQTLALLPKVDASFDRGNEEGLTGIALDPNFKSNRHIFLFYTDDKFNYLSRFTLAPGGMTLDLTTEKVLFQTEQKFPSIHTGGALQFDPAGNLWVTVGEDGQFTTSANTNSLLGKILRIRPTADGKYTIPSGNLFPEGTPKTKPEIYAMGTRNAYTLTLDTIRNGITWGDVGPDQGWITEEHNFTTKPGNFGFPIYAGNNLNLIGAGNGAPSMPSGGAGTVAAPLNNFDDNTGLKELPPAIPAIYSYKKACAITGPVYYYNPKLVSKFKKMPPHFDGVWFIAEFNQKWYKAFKLNEPGTKIMDSLAVFNSMVKENMLDFQAGPDGTFYVNVYGGWKTAKDETGLYRIRYNGTCNPTEFDRGWGVNIINRSLPKGILRSGNQVEFTLPGSHEILLSDLGGRRINRFAGSGPAKYDISNQVQTGVYLLTLTTQSGTVSSKIVIE